ncbi:MAG: ABC transporter permease [Myxococcota bacterium]|nr:ABC transporter permease [Myxococcota bacterium]
MSSLGRIVAIAGNTVREAIRNKVLYALLFFGVLLIGTGILVSSLSYVEGDRILQSVGLSSLRLFGAAIAIFVGVNLIHKEVDRRTIYTVLSKPLSRAEFLIGKFAGLVATLWLQVAVMAVAFVAVSLLSGAPLTGGHAAAVVLAAIELAVLVAVATLFSSFTTPMLASLFTAGFYVVGHVTRDLRELGSQSDVSSVQTMTAFLHRSFPDLEAFNLTTHAIHGLPITQAQVVWPLLYGVAYMGVLLTLACLVFQRRDFR